MEKILGIIRMAGDRGPLSVSGRRNHHFDLGMRNFCMETKGGERLAYANTYWTYINAENGLPVKLTERDTAAYGLEPKLDMDYAPRKIKLPGEYEQQEAFAVQKHHLDTNHHVNNCQYVQMAMDYLPADFRIHQMRAEDTKTTILLNDQKSEQYAIVEFM